MICLGVMVLSAPVWGQGFVPDEDYTPTVNEGENGDATGKEASEQAEEQKQTEPTNPRRPATYQEALAAAGDDGIMVYCYGPDWNQRSVRMLKSFWMSKEVENAGGNALLVAVPVYEYPTPAQKERADTISAGLPGIPFGVCPTVMMLDKTGRMYINLPGTDYLGDEKGGVGVANIAKYLAAHRKMLELLKKAEGLQGAEKAKVLGEIGDLPIKKPEGLVQMLKEADPGDSTGLVRRNTHVALDFLYKQMDTKDGFLKQDFHKTLRDLKVEGMKVVNDEALRPEDRQAAYCLLVGQARREEGGGKSMKTMVKDAVKIAPKSFYGTSLSSVNRLWGSERADETAAQKRERREKEREADKKHREHERDVRNSERRTNVE